MLAEKTDTHTTGTRLEDPEINPHGNSYLHFDKDIKKHMVEMTNSPLKKKLSICKQKNDFRVIFLPLHKTNLK